MIEIRDRIAGPFSALNGIPATVAEPELGEISVPKCPHGRGLARPVRAEEAEHLAVADIERNVLERDALAEALAQMLNLKRVLAPCRRKRTGRRMGPLRLRPCCGGSRIHSTKLAPAWPLGYKTCPAC